jgi:hypothetical protein
MWLLSLLSNKKTAEYKDTSTNTLQFENGILKNLFMICIYIVPIFMWKYKYLYISISTHILHMENFHQNVIATNQNLVGGK